MGPAPGPAPEAASTEAVTASAPAPSCPSGAPEDASSASPAGTALPGTPVNAGQLPPWWQPSHAMLACLIQAIDLLNSGMVQAGVPARASPGPAPPGGHLQDNLGPCTTATTGMAHGSAAGAMPASPLKAPAQGPQPAPAAHAAHPPAANHAAAAISDAAAAQQHYVMHSHRRAQALGALGRRPGSRCSPGSAPSRASPLSSRSSASQVPFEPAPSSPRHPLQRSASSVACTGAGAQPVNSSRSGSCTQPALAFEQGTRLQINVGQLTSTGGLTGTHSSSASHGSYCCSAAFVTAQSLQSLVTAL